MQAHDPMTRHYLKACSMLLWGAAVYGVAVPHLMSAPSDAGVLGGVLLGGAAAVPLVGYLRTSYYRVRAHFAHKAAKKELGL